VLIGASGTIGRPLADALAERHEVVRVAHTRGDFQVDITSKDSIERLLETLAPFDAVVCVAGDVRFKPLEDLTDEDFAVGLTSKLMGQAAVTLIHPRVVSCRSLITSNIGFLHRSRPRSLESGGKFASHAPHASQSLVFSDIARYACVTAWWIRHRCVTA
jgi:hypothetical protein